ncbi:MAG: LPS export ABC transporter ATP-binding protein [Candidatus Caenarcaniphilales bacterium]|jgi:lipopolysaccharide export system ATP-binding protein|nr:LPS export ABC transporter ATP-binding protein [Candidatus Caenarcaniphilales bacterium]
MSTSGLVAIGLSKSYSGRKVVKDVSFDIQAGEIVALLGPNGAGKTTSFDMVVGLVKPDSGEIYINGQNITDDQIHQRAFAGIGYLTQEPSAFRQLSVRKNLELVLETMNKSKTKSSVTEILEEFGIDHLQDSLAISLSGGERRRLEIARVLICDPKFILLDEPFTGIDPVAIIDIQNIIKDLCKSRKIGLLITDHNPLATLSITDRAYIIQEGAIVKQGSSYDIAEDPMVKKFYLGENFKLTY